MPPSSHVKKLRRSQGLCPSCGLLPATGKVSCQRCLEYGRKAKRKAHQKAIETNICTDCFKENAADGKHSCQKCLDARKVKMKTKRQDITLCVTCGKANDNPEQKTCDKCKSKSKKRYSSKIKEGVCVKCSKPNPGSAVCGDCLVKLSNRKKLLREERFNNNLCTVCGVIPPVMGIKLCLECQDRNKAKRLKLKLEVFDNYGGPKCNCCGETQIEFLTLDHMHNDGHQHRLEVGAGVYQDLRKKGYPEGFQVLCMNCNWAKGHYGECPHKRHSPKG